MVIDIFFEYINEQLEQYLCRYKGLDSYLQKEEKQTDNTAPSSVNGTKGYLTSAWNLVKSTKDVVSNTALAVSSAPNTAYWSLAGVINDNNLSLTKVNITCSLQKEIMALKLDEESELKPSDKISKVVDILKDYQDKLWHVREQSKSKGQIDTILEGLISALEYLVGINFNRDNVFSQIVNNLYIKQKEVLDNAIVKDSNIGRKEHVKIMRLDLAQDLSKVLFKMILDQHVYAKFGAANTVDARYTTLCSDLRKIVHHIATSPANQQSYYTDIAELSLSISKAPFTSSTKCLEVRVQDIWNTHNIQNYRAGIDTSKLTEHRANTIERVDSHSDVKNRRKTGPRANLA